MIWAFLTARGLFGLAKGWWLLIVVAALVGLGVWLSAREAADDRRNQAIGATKAISAGQTVTLQQNKEANDAGHKVRDNRGSAVFDECVRSATAETRVNCERFRNQPLPD
jgi:hypothetical protein